MTLMWRKVNEESGMITTGISKGMGGLSTIWYTEKTTIRTPWYLTQMIQKTFKPLKFTRLILWTVLSPMLHLPLVEFTINIKKLVWSVSYHMTATQLFMRFLVRVLKLDYRTHYNSWRPAGIWNNQIWGQICRLKVSIRMIVSLI